MTPTRRQFLQGLVATAVAAAIPLPEPSMAAGLVSQVAPLQAAKNRLLSPDIVGKEMLRLLREHLTFRKDYDIEHDRLIYVADYHVPAHEIGPPLQKAPTLPIRGPFDEELDRKYVPEVRYQVGVELPKNYRDELPALEEMMASEIEARLHGGE